MHFKVFELHKNYNEFNDFFRNQDLNWLKDLIFFNHELKHLKWFLLDNNPNRFKTVIVMLNSDNSVIGATSLNWVFSECGDDSSMVCSTYSTIHLKYQGKGLSKQLINFKAKYLQQIGIKRLKISNYTSEGSVKIKRYEKIYESYQINLIN